MSDGNTRHVACHHHLVHDGVVITMSTITWRTHVTTWLRFITGNRLAPYHGMPSEALNAMFKLVKPTASDVLIDLGCGDGRLLIKSAQSPYNVRRCVGYELNSDVFMQCQHAVKQANLTNDQVQIHHANAKQADLSDASIITLYLSERGNRSLLPILLPKLRVHPATRIASFVFPIPTLQPVHKTTVSRRYTHLAVQRLVTATIVTGSWLSMHISNCVTQANIETGRKLYGSANTVDTLSSTASGAT